MTKLPTTVILREEEEDLKQRRAQTLKYIDNLDERIAKVQSELDNRESSKKSRLPKPASKMVNLRRDIEEQLVFNRKKREEAHLAMKLLKEQIDKAVERKWDAYKRANNKELERWKEMLS